MASRFAQLRAVRISIGGLGGGRMESRTIGASIAVAAGAGSCRRWQCTFE